MTAPNAYNMYQYRDQEQTGDLMFRASREEASAKGWVLGEEDFVAATNVAAADQIAWEASQRPLSALVAKAGELTIGFRQE